MADYQLKIDRGVALTPEYRRRLGEVSELVDEHDLGSCAERRPGSSPGFPTKNKHIKLDYITMFAMQEVPIKSLI